MAISTTLQEVLVEFAPLFGLSFSIFALKGFRLSYRAKWSEGFWLHIVDIILSSIVGAFLIVGFCIIVMSMRPELNELAIVGLTVLLSVGGVSFVDNIIFKYFGIRILDAQEVRGTLKRKKEEE